MMKKMILFFFVLSSFAGKVNGDFSDLAGRALQSIIIKEEKVFIQINDVWLVTEALQATPEGIFVLVHGEWMTIREAIENYECFRKTWKCKKCKFVNYEDIYVCPVCGTPRY